MKHWPSSSSLLLSSDSPNGFARLWNKNKNSSYRFSSPHTNAAIPNFLLWNHSVKGINHCLWPYLPPLFWSRNSVAGSTISNWIGVPGAMSCVESWMPADSFGIILSFSIFFTFWLKWKKKISINQWHPIFALEGRQDYSKIQRQDWITISKHK